MLRDSLVWSQRVYSQLLVLSSGLSTKPCLPVCALGNVFTGAVDFHRFKLSSPKQKPRRLRRGFAFRFRVERDLPLTPTLSPQERGEGGARDQKSMPPLEAGLARLQAF